MTPRDARTHPGDTSPDPLSAGASPLAILAVWASFWLPLGSKYACTLACAVLAVQMRRRAPASSRTKAAVLPATVLLLAFLTLSALWSPAPWSRIGSSLWQYGLLLLVPLIGGTWPPQAARQALRHLPVCAALAGLVFLLGHAGLLPASPWLWHTTLDAEGNQRIATSVLLAMGACFALLQINDRRSACVWGTLALVASIGLSLQDRRSGMLLLPLLLLTWALARPADWGRRLALGTLVLLAALAAWHLSEGVRTRFAEGVAELQQYQADDDASTSWGQRLRMGQRTLDMVREHPLTGHGIASWIGLWQQRVRPGTALSHQTTAHNEYLMLAQQVGLVGLALWLWVLVSGLRDAAHHGRAGLPALLGWTAVAYTCLFNAALRDAKFSLPLLLVAALATAAMRDAARPLDRHARSADKP